MLPWAGGSAKELSVSGTPRKTADNPKTVGSCLNKASFIFGYVGNLTDSFRGQVRNGLLELEVVRWLNMTLRR
jgi:hypothetical protein